MSKINYLSEKAIAECGLRYDEDIVEMSGMTDEEIEDALLRVCVAQNKTISNYSNDEIKSLIKMIMLSRYIKNYNSRLN